MKISKAWFEEGKALVQSGDLSLSERRACFAHVSRRPTTLDDEKLTAASMTDDDDDEEFVRNVLDIEANGLEITEDAESETETIG
jgi:hypothetical protein